VPHVPGITDIPNSSFKPDTPAMSIGLLLNNVCPRAMLARAWLGKFPGCGFDQLSNRLKMTGVNPK